MWRKIKMSKFEARAAEFRESADLRLYLRHDVGRRLRLLVIISRLQNRSTRPKCVNQEQAQPSLAAVHHQSPSLVRQFQDQLTELNLADPAIGVIVEYPSGLVPSRDRASDAGSFFDRDDCGIQGPPTWSSDAVTHTGQRGMD